MAGTLAWGRKSIAHHGTQLADDAWALEGSLVHAGWTVFGRAESTENRELSGTGEPGHGPAQRVGKASLGAVRDVRVGPRLLVGLGGLLSVNDIPEPLRASYGGRHPRGAMVFLRLKLDQDRR
ncbi:MAG: hypothetical protein EOP93_22440 [Lysobacteraceae bacterium]|nr:MAG: hypothetical protein EOP93_22440 [Xanthomonadaceae bacterium]